jgi:hypothetical protein
LLKGEPATMSREVPGITRLGTLASAGPRGWKLFTAILPGVAGYQARLVPTYALVADAAFVILPRQPTEAAATHHGFLDRRIAPVHPI